MNRDNNRSFFSTSFWLFAGILILLLGVYIWYRIQARGEIVIPMSIFAIMAGLIFEYKRISRSWFTVMATMFASFVISFLIFLPFKREGTYVLENHIVAWPYVFCGLFTFIAMIVHSDRIIPRLTEGITLLQSLALIYFVIDMGFDARSILVKILFGIGLIFSLFTLFHAFTHFQHSRASRLWLSVWSSLIMLLLAIENCYRIYVSPSIESSSDLLEGIANGAQYFLLGISSIYMAQNLIMLGGFLPGKGTFFNAQYFRELEELKDTHIARYSEEQVPITLNLLALFFTSGVFFFNHYYDFLPRNFVVWMLFMIFPLIINLAVKERR